MGARFHKWLARPSTLRFFRELVAPAEVEAGDLWRRSLLHGSCVRRRRQATAAVALAGGEEKDAVHQPVRIRKVVSHAQQLDLSSPGYGLGAPTRSRAPFFDPSLPWEDTFEALSHQADVNSDRKYGTLFVDAKAHRDNFQLWIELLHFRQRIDGLHGVLDVWYGMRRRHVDLPLEGLEADVLWNEFAMAAAACDDTVRDMEAYRRELVTYAKDTKVRRGRHYAGFHKFFVGQLCRTNAIAAAYWHKQLVEASIAPPYALKDVAIDLVQNHSLDQSWDAFVQMYNQSQERDLYDQLIPRVLVRGGIKEALRWHCLLLNKGDGPSQEVLASKEVHELFKRDGDRPLPIEQNLQAEASAPAGTPGAKAHEYPPMTRSSMSTLVGDVHGIKAKAISDNFLAKMFATRAFDLDLIMQGLTFFSVERLGPVAVRELALRAGSLVSFSSKLDMLKSMNIKLTDAAYCRIVHNIADEGLTDVFKALLVSDQHPESYDDLEVQDKLLVHFLKAGDFSQAQVTAHGLSLAGVRTEGWALNRLLQHHLEMGSWRNVEQIMQNIQAQKAWLTRTTIFLMWKHLLPERHRGKSPVHQRLDQPHFDALDFVTNACIYNLQLKGGEVHYKMWIELLKRHGMRGDWQDVEKLVRFIAWWYGCHQDSGESSEQDGQSMETGNSPLCLVLSWRMQQAVMTWAFRSAAEKRQLRKHEPSRSLVSWNKHPLPFSVLSAEQSPVQPWAQGLALLWHLKRQKVPIITEAIQREFATRMWILFGPGHSSRPVNEVARRHNELRLADYIQHANDVWPGFISGLKPALFEPQPLNEGLLRLAFFGRIRKAWVRRDEGLQEYVDVGAWADDYINGRGKSTQAGRISHRDCQWFQSPYRRVQPLKKPRDHTASTDRMPVPASNPHNTANELPGSTHNPSALPHHHSHPHPPQHLPPSAHAAS